MIPDKAPGKGDMELKSAITCKQARLPVEELGHQPCHKTFKLQFVQFSLPTRCAGLNKGGVDIMGAATKMIGPAWDPYHEREPTHDTT